MKKFIFTLSTAILVFNPSLAIANEEVVDSVTGVNYEVNELGEFARIRAVGEAELEIGDRADIRTATQKAQMRAKANIAKFLSERVTSEEVMNNIEKSTTSTDGDQKQISRETISEYTETIRNSAEALLKGVITTKTDINKDEKYIQIEVGISPKTMSAADTLNNSLKKDNSGDSGNGRKIESETGREIKKIKNYDSF